LITAVSPFIFFYAADFVDADIFDFIDIFDATPEFFFSRFFDYFLIFTAYAF